MNTDILKDKRLLITGGTGSFGNALIRRILGGSVKEIRVLSRDEKKQDDMRRAYQSDKLKFFLGDVRNLASLNEAMSDVDYVFSAAALKQVPSCEFYPLEAVYTNVLGTDNTLTSAIAHNVPNVVVLSTDKAVNPINAMGMTKAVMEKVAIAKSRNALKTKICLTRYGNVMGSRGSVIPLFVEQILEGKPITVTDPEMTRFMMTLDDAIDLVLYAFAHGESGDTFVQKAPASTIGQLARVLRKLFSSRAEIRTIGTRHGEKKHETLLSREEMAHAVDLDEYYRIPADTRSLNYGLFFEQGEKRINELDEYTSSNTRRLSDEELRKLLLSLPMVQEKMNSDRRRTTCPLEGRAYA